MLPRPGDAKRFRLIVTPDLAGESEGFPVRGDLGWTRPPKRALPAEKRDRLEQVRLPLSVLPGDQGDAGAEENGVRREVAEGPGGDFEEAQGFLFQRRIGITTYT